MSATLLALLVALGSFIAIGIFSARAITSPREFFHKADFRHNVISLVVANLTLGTGLAYLFVIAKQQGLLALATPLSLLGGYFLFASLQRHLQIKYDKGCPNFFAFVDAKIKADTGRSIFAFVVASLLIVSYALLAGFEVFVSSQIIAAILAGGSNQSLAIFLGVLLFFVVSFYTVVGGIRAVFNTDLVQFLLIIIMIIAGLLILFIPSSAGESKGPLVLYPASIQATLPATIATFAIALTTQFYSILNWGTAANLAPERHAQLFRYSGLITFLVLCTFVVGGVVTSDRASGDPLSDLLRMFGSLSAISTSWNHAFSFLVVLGFVSLLFSTIDSALIYIGTLFYDLPAGRSSHDDRTNPDEVRSIRHVLAGLFIAIMAFTSVLYAWQPDIYQILLVILSALSALSPMILLAAFLSIKRRRFTVLQPKFVLVFVAVASVVFCVCVLSLLKAATVRVEVVLLSGLGLSSAIAIVLFTKSRAVDHD